MRLPACMRNVHHQYLGYHAAYAYRMSTCFGSASMSAFYPIVELLVSPRSLRMYVHLQALNWECLALPIMLAAPRCCDQAPFNGCCAGHSAQCWSVPPGEHCSQGGASHAMQPYVWEGCGSAVHHIYVCSLCCKKRVRQLPVVC